MTIRSATPIPISTTTSSGIFRGGETFELGENRKAAFVVQTDSATNFEEGQQHFPRATQMSVWFEAATIRPHFRVSFVAVCERDFD